MKLKLWDKPYRWLDWRQVKENAKLSLQEAKDRFLKEQEYYYQKHSLYYSHGGLRQFSDTNEEFTPEDGDGEARTPTPKGGQIPYNQAIIEAWGGGGKGTLGFQYNNGNYTGAGGGGGAYCKKTISITPSTVIQYTIGTGSSIDYVSGGDTTISVDGVLLMTAGGGQTLPEPINPQYFPEIQGPATGGIASGGDVNINGEDSEQGHGSFVGSNAASGPADGFSDGGDGANGGAGGASCEWETQIGGQPIPSKLIDGGNGEFQGGGGGGGGPSLGLYYGKCLPGSGSNGEVKITFGYA